MTTDNQQNPSETTSKAQSAAEKPVEGANNTTETPDLQAQPKAEQAQGSFATSPPSPKPLDPVQLELQEITKNLKHLLRVIQHNLACQETLKLETLSLKKAASFGRQWGEEANSNFVLAVKVKRRLAKARARLAS